MSCEESPVTVIAAVVVAIAMLFWAAAPAARPVLPEAPGVRFVVSAGPVHFTFGAPDAVAVIEVVQP